MLPFRLHPHGRDRPRAFRLVDLGPRGEPNFRRPRRGQHEELERQPDGGLPGLRRSYRLDGRGHILVGQPLPVRHDVVLRTEHRHHPVAWVVVPHVEGDGPFQHRPDVLADLPGGRRLDVPGRREDLQHVGRVDLRDRPAADAGKDIPLHAPPPVPRVPPAALLFEDALGGFSEGRHSLDAALLREGIAVRAGQHAVGEGLLAGLGERDERGGAEPEFAASAADDEPLDPASGAVGWTNRYSPLPSACLPGGAERTKAAESALSGWRPRRLVLRVVVAVLATTSIPPSNTGCSRIPLHVLTRSVRGHES